MFQLGDIFKIGFSCMNQQPSLEEKLSNQNLPLEDFLKDDEAVSTAKFMGKNAKKYLNSDKIKQLIKLITEEPKEDDQLHGHKYPYVAYEILKLDCPFISKRFVLNEQEYHEEYPGTLDNESEDWGLDLDIENENNEIENDFKKNKIEFDKIYAKIKEDFRNLKNSVNSDTEVLKSKDDDYKDEYKYENNEDNNYEEGNEEYEENKEDNVIDNDKEYNKENLKDNNKDKEIEINNNKDETNLKNENISENKEHDECNKKDEKQEKEDIKENNQIEDNINKNNVNEEKINIKEKNEKLANNKSDEDIKENIKESMNEKKSEETDEKEENKNEEENEIKEESKKDEIKEESKKEEAKEKSKGDTKEEEITEENKEEIKEENKIENKEEENKEEPNKKEYNKEEENKEEKNKEEYNKEEENKIENKEEENKGEENKEEKKEEGKEGKISEVVKEPNEIKEKKENIEILKEEREDSNQIEQNKTEEGNQINKLEEKNNKENTEEGKKENFIPEEKVLKENEENKDIRENKQEINEIQNNKKEDYQKEKDLEINNQEEETNEEINNIIIDKTEEEKEKENTQKNIYSENIENNNNNEEAIDDMERKSLSVEGELDDEINKKKKAEKNNENNEFLDLLLKFVMTDKPELNYVLSGYFVNVILSLLNNYPYKIIKYLYTKRRDALKKIIFHSNQKAFAILSAKLLNLESFFKPSQDSKESINELINENISYRNELIKEIINSINLDGMEQDKGIGIDIEAIFSLISDLINDNTLLAKELIFNDYLCPHLFNILDTDLYANVDNIDQNNFNTRYNIYSLFINLTSKFIKVINTNYSSLIPMDFDFNNLQKKKEELHFNDNIIISFGKILKNNFIAKKPILILEKNSSLIYEGLGALNLHIFDLVKNMFFFMKGLPRQFDLLLIRNNFCQRSIEFFFKYQWNNLYQNKFIEFFNIYLENEERHNELTQFYFNNIKLQNLLINFLEEKIDENNSIFQKIKFEFKSGNKINSGIYPHVIDLIYKIQAYSDMDIFTEEEKNQFSIKNLGEFEFSKDEKSNKIIKKLNISNNLKNILSKDENWNSTFKNKVLPVLRIYEGQLCKKKKIIDDDDLDIKNDFGTNGLMLQQMLNMLKKTTPIKRFSLPISRNDKNSSINVLNRNRNEKSSIREKLLSKGYQSRHIFDEEDDDDKNDKENNNLNGDLNIEDKYEEENEEINKNNKMFNDTNYWELKNDLPENIKKEVDKKTNIIFNYNPITGENEKKDDISEEDELLSIAMGLEQDEKMEKNKKIMYIMPGKLKPINLKTKSNPVQNIFINIANNNKNNIKLEKLRNKKKEIINMFNNEINEENEDEDEEIVKKNGNKEDIIKELKKEEDNENTMNDNNDIEEEAKNKMFNDVNYWKTNENYLSEEEKEDLLNEL